MLEVRRDRDIHKEEGGWFTARWHFSFDHYRDPNQMGVGPLRVFNHDRLIAGASWPMHPHADVEGITYVWKGSFRHADSLDEDGVLQAGGVQLMTLGSGALHSEQNASRTEPMEFLQLWILPDAPSLQPAVQQRQFRKADRTDRLLKVVGAEAGDPVRVHQNAAVYVAALSPGTSVSHAFAPGRGGYLYLIEGALSISPPSPLRGGSGRGSVLTTGDAVKIYEEPNLSMRADGPSELILVDVPLRFTPVGVWAK